MTAFHGALDAPARSLEETLSDLMRLLDRAAGYDPQRRRIERMIADLEAEIEFRHAADN